MCIRDRYKINPNARKIICCGKKRPKCHFQPKFSWVGLALGWGVRRFHHNIYQVLCFPTQHNLVNRKTAFLRTCSSVRQSPAIDVRGELSGLRLHFLLEKSLGIQGCEWDICFCTVYWKGLTPACSKERGKSPARNFRARFSGDILCDCIHTRRRFSGDIFHDRYTYTQDTSPPQERDFPGTYFMICIDTRKIRHPLNSEIFRGHTINISYVYMYTYTQEIFRGHISWYVYICTRKISHPFPR